jgi:hypothetical protein
VARFRTAGTAHVSARPVTKSTTRVVRERIDPRLTASLFANYRTGMDALLELVDNAVDARVTGRPMRLDIALRPGTISLTATGGSGMDARQLERDYLRWGASPKRAGERIGRYGQGGKAAIGHLGNRFRVVASAAGEERAHAFQDDDYRDRSALRTYELHDVAKPVGAALGYVHISIGEVDRKLDPGRVRLRLAQVYRPLLTTGAVVMTVDRAVVAPAPWDLAEEHPFNVRTGGHMVKGWWGLLPDPPPPGSESGIRVYHLGRLVGEPAWFGHQGPSLHPSLARIVGEVEVPHVPVTMNKSDVDRDSLEWAAVEARLHTLLGPVVRRLSREAAPPASPQSLKIADQVRRILARALRMLESGVLFDSPNTGGSGDGMETDGQLTLDGVRSVPDEPQGTDPEEPGPEAVGSEAEAAQDRIASVPPVTVGQSQTPHAARRGIGDVVIRPLDPRVRSVMVEEDGVRRIVINSRYPLYDVRNGDLWYQLETALREVCVTIPEATVPEFEAKVNELMLVSLSLTARARRRPRPAQRTTPAGL